MLPIVNNWTGGYVEGQLAEMQPADYLLNGNNEGVACNEFLPVQGGVELFPQST